MEGIPTSAVHFIRSIQTVSTSITSPDIRDTVSIITLPLALMASQLLTYKHTKRETKSRTKRYDALLLEQSKSHTG